MLKYQGGKASVRKLRLFACGCCRLIWHLLSDERCRRAVEVAEEYADGLAPEEELRAARLGARAAMNDDWQSIPVRAAVRAARAADSEGNSGGVPGNPVFSEASSAASRAHEAISTSGTSLKESLEQANLLRDLFGNPFAPVTLSPTWRTASVVAVARGIYVERQFDELPILADALEEAGCEDTRVLNHCRQLGEHARGCWLLDGLLGQT
jgi:hypothetical protein